LDQLNLVPPSCGGALDAPQLAARVRRRRFTSFGHKETFKAKAKEIMQDIDIDDSFFVALAMSLNCPIWSNDTHMKKQSVVKVYTTNEIMDYLRLL